MPDNTILKKKDTHSAAGQSVQPEFPEVESDLRFISSANLCIIRELFKLIKPKEISMPEFYSFLAAGWNDISKEELDLFIDGFEHAIRGNGDIKKFIRILTEYGISEEYFMDNRPMDADADILAKFTEYCKGTDRVTENGIDKIRLKECRQALLSQVFSVKNLDGTLVVHCLKRIILDMQHINKNENLELFDLAEKISQLELHSHLSQDRLKKYYEDFAKNYKNQEIPALPKQGSKSKNIYSSKATGDTICDTLFLIREAYLALASIDKPEEPAEESAEKFYAQINISEEEYEEMLSSKQVDARKLLCTFAPYKFPASLFRGDSATVLCMDKDMEHALSDYRNEIIGLEQFRILLKLNLFYCVKPKNFLFFFAVYSLYNKITYNP